MYKALTLPDAPPGLRPNTAELFADKSQATRETRDYEREFVDSAETGNPEAVGIALNESHLYLTLAGQRLVNEATARPVEMPNSRGVATHAVIPFTDENELTTYIRAEVTPGKGKNAPKTRTIISAELLGVGASEVRFTADENGVRTNYEVWKDGEWHPQQVSAREEQSLLRGLMTRMGEARREAAALGPEEIEKRTVTLLVRERSAELGGPAVAAE